MRLVRFEEGQVEFALLEGGSRNLATDLSRKLQDWTGRRWMVAVSSEPGQATLRETAEAAEAELRSGAATHPLAQAVLTSFPGATIVDIRERAKAAAEEDPGLPAPPADFDLDDDL